MSMLTWQVLTPGLERVQVYTHPTVVLIVARQHGTVERQIAAFFETLNPGARWKVLPLRREGMPDAPGVFDLSKTLIEGEWNDEHVRWGEKEILREMFLEPRMSNHELEALSIKRAKRLAEARERGAKIMAERQKRRKDQANR